MNGWFGGLLNVTVVFYIFYIFSNDGDDSDYYDDDGDDFGDDDVLHIGFVFYVSLLFSHLPSNAKLSSI